MGVSTVLTVNSQKSDYRQAVSSSPAGKADKWADLIENRYPDLDPKDCEIVRNYYIAKERGNCQEAKRKLIARVGLLADKIRLFPLKTEEKLTLLARLVNLHGILRENDITVAELKSMINYRDIKVDPGVPASLDGIWQKPIEISPKGIKQLADKGDPIAKEMMAYLIIEKEKGYTYFQYLSDNVNSIIFLPRLKDYFKIFPGDQSSGAAEELTKCVVLGTYDEINSKCRDIWNIIGSGVHECKHIDNFHKAATAIDPEVLKHIPNEINSYKGQNTFLSDLLNAANTPGIRIYLNEESKLEAIQEKIILIEGKMKDIIESKDQGL